MTADMPDPESIAKQKAVHLKDLNATEKQTLDALEEQRKQHLAIIHQQAEQQRQQVLEQIVHEGKRMEVSLGQDFTQQVAQTKMKYSNLRSALEQQAISLTAEYQQKHVQDVAMKQQAELRQENAKSELKFMAEMQQLQPPPYMTRLHPTPHKTWRSQMAPT